MTFSLKYANSFFNVILMGGDNVLYDYSFKNYTDAPELYPYGAYIVAINKDEDSEQYSNKLVAVSKEGTAYNLDDMFPIVVNGVELDTDKSIHVSFNKKQRNFRIIIKKIFRNVFRYTNTLAVIFTYFKHSFIVTKISSFMEIFKSFM